MIIDGGDSTAFYERLGFVRTGETRPLTRDRSRTASLPGPSGARSR